MKITNLAQTATVRLEARALTPKQIISMEAALLKRGTSEDQVLQIMESATNLSPVVEIGGKAIGANSIAGRLARQGLALAAERKAAAKRETLADLREELARLRALVAVSA